MSLQDYAKAAAQRAGIDGLRRSGQRRRLLDYVRKNDVERYRSIIGRLGIRR